MSNSRENFKAFIFLFAISVYKNAFRLTLAHQQIANFITGFINSVIFFFAFQILIRFQCIIVNKI